MDSHQFRIAANQLIEYIAEHIENLREKPVLPDVEPGYLKKLVPDQAPEKGEPWSDIFNDIEPIIMKGMTQWHAPCFHGYFPTGNSYPGILADMLSTSLACIGFSWYTAPSCTELEMRMMDWLSKMLALPNYFCFESGQGGGIIQTTASDSTLIAMLCARTDQLHHHGFSNRIEEDENSNDARYRILSRLVAYTSQQAHSSVEKAALLSAIRIRMVPVSNEDLSIDCTALQNQIDCDREKGLIPFIVVATLGTTNTCAFDDLEQLGSICEKEQIWLHCDAAYAGAAFLCPEFRHYMTGIEHVTSFSMNPHKWMLVNFDCNALWIKDKRLIEKAFDVEAEYLKHPSQNLTLDYRHWQIPLGRRFRSLKLWFVIRCYGVEGLREHIRNQIKLAELFGSFLKSDDRFELIDQIRMGLVCFRLKGTNELNERLLHSINSSRKIFLTPSKIKELYFLRLAICSRNCNEQDILYSWNFIKQQVDQL